MAGLENPRVENLVYFFILVLDYNYHNKHPCVNHDPRYNQQTTEKKD